MSNNGSKYWKWQWRSFFVYFLAPILTLLTISASLGLSFGAVEASDLAGVRMVFAPAMWLLSTVMIGMTIGLIKRKLWGMALFYLASGMGIFKSLLNASLARNDIPRLLLEIGIVLFVLANGIYFYKNRDHAYDSADSREIS